MFKFLRKYNKWILSVGGVLLMITFLIPQAITGLSQQAGAASGTWATLGDGESISATQHQQAIAELMVVQRLPIAVPGAGFIREPAHWYLMAREAADAGLVPNPSAIDDATVQVYQSMTGEPNVGLIRAVAAKMQGIQRLAGLYDTYGLYSDRRLSVAAARLLHTVTAQTVVLKPGPEDAAEEPAEGAIAAQFDSYKDKLPGEGERGFGYKLPNRLKLEWIEIQYGAVESAVERSDAFDGVAQQLHWRRNPRGVFPPVEAGSPVPDVVRDDLLANLTNAKLEEMAKYAADQLRLSQRGIPTQDGYLTLPEDWATRRLDLQALAADLQARFGVDLPAYQAIGDRWLTLDEIGAIENLGIASTDKFGALLGLPAVLAQLHEFGGGTPAIVQEGVGLPLRGPDASLYVARVTEAEAAREPTSLDEEGVRDAVIADLKRQMAFDALAQRLAELEAEAESKGMLMFALDHDTLLQSTSSVFLTSPFALSQRLQGQNANLSPSPLPAIGENREAVEAIIDYALTLPADQPASALSEAERVIAVRADDSLAIVVARLMTQNPLTLEMFDSLLQQGGIHALVSDEERPAETRIDEDSPFSLDALVKRHGMVIKGGGETDEDGDAADAPAGPATAAAN